MAECYDQEVCCSAECKYPSSCLKRLLPHTSIHGMQTLTSNAFLYMGLCEGFAWYLAGHNGIIFLISLLGILEEVGVW